MTTTIPLYAPHYVSLDIEMRGKDMMNHPVTAIGLYVGPIDRATLL